MKTPLIAPSILSADFATLGEEVAAITKAGADWVHVDVMDGHFVPNITIGPGVVKAIKPHTSLPMDVHLMVSQVDRHVEAFVDAGADYVTIHAEDPIHLHRSLQQIRNLGVKAGVSLNPATPLSAIEYVLEEADLILIMSVNPGFGGQKFIESQVRKIAALREMITHQGLDTLIEVDGGVTTDNVHRIMEAGADVLVAGTAVFKGGQYAENITALKAAAG